MAVNIKSGAGAWYLQTYLYKKLLPNFEPNLKFYDMWEKPMVQDWFGTVSWAKASKLTTSAASATLTEWTPPTWVAFSYSTISTTPTQYWIVVQISDRLLKAAPTKILDNAAKEVWNNMARIVDQVIQTEVMAWTNVVYADAVANRAAIWAWNTLGADELRKAVVKLRGLDAPEVEGWDFVAITHPFCAWDVRAESNGAWLEFSKYTTPDKLFKWETWKLHWARVVESSNIQTFASTVTVYPTLVVWAGAYWVTEWNALETIYKPLWQWVAWDVLNQAASVGAKIDFAAKRLQEDAMVRIESSAWAY